MAKKAGEMTFYGDPPDLVVADSVFDLKIEDVEKIKPGTRMITEKIALLELSDAAWSMTFFHDLSFWLNIHDFPEVLKSKSKAVFSVSCDGQELTVYLREEPLLNSQTNGSFRNVKYFVKNNKITLSCRLLITCEGTSSVINFLN